jgi:hypothetical protein
MFIHQYMSREWHKAELELIGGLLIPVVVLLTK